MARHPEWFERLDAITEVVRQSSDLEWIGRKEMKGIFSCSERDSICLLHKFGAQDRDDALSLPRSALLAQLMELHSRHLQKFGSQISGLRPVCGRSLCSP